MTLSISGKTAIVTGAGKGIGQAIARHFAESGANVMCADHDEAALCAGVSEDPDGRVRHFCADMNQKLAMANLLSATIDAFDRVDILVNAHRLMTPGDPLCTDEEVLESMLRKNMMSGLRLSQIVARRMIQQAEGEDGAVGQAGSIVSLSGQVSGRIEPDLMAYSIACAAQHQAVRGLALALAPHRIRVNGVAFSSVMSDQLQVRLKENPDWRDRIVDGTPMGRIAAADELVDTVHYLVSEGAGFVTGQILNVDGGRSLSDPVGVPVY